MSLGYKRIVPADSLQRPRVEFVTPNGDTHLFEIDEEDEKGIRRWERGGVALEDAAPTLRTEQRNAILYGVWTEEELPHGASSRSVLKRYEEALRTIAEWSTSQPPDLNIPECEWRGFCVRKMQRWALQALNGVPLED